MPRNLGRLQQFIGGIQGVAAGSHATINFAVNRRYHRNKLLVSAIAYTGGVGLAVVAITGTGSGATVTPTVVKGVVTAIDVVAAGAGYADGDTVTFIDATGVGYVGTVAETAGAIDTISVDVGGIVAPTDPQRVISSLRQVVNGTPCRDISPRDIKMISQAVGIYPLLGELALDYTEPRLAFIKNGGEDLAWDMGGQGDFSYDIAIRDDVTSPSITGVQEFDGFRNVGADGKPTINPVIQHTFSMNVNAGVTSNTTLPFLLGPGVPRAIRRLFLRGSTPGNITRVDVFQDGQLPQQITRTQLRQMAKDYGFFFGNVRTLPDDPALLNAVEDYDFAFISDPDQRYWRALNCDSSFKLDVYSDAQQTIQIIMESLPGSYIG